METASSNSSSSSMGGVREQIYAICGYLAHSKPTDYSALTEFSQYGEKEPEKSLSTLEVLMEQYSNRIAGKNARHSLPSVPSEDSNNNNHNGSSSPRQRSETPSIDEDRIFAVKEFFDFLEERKLTVPVLKSILILESKNCSLLVLFREETIGMSLLTEYWTKQENRIFADFVLNPLVKKVVQLDHSLEIVQMRAEKGANIKANLIQLLDLVKDFLESIYNTEGLFSENLIDILKSVDVEIAKRSSDIGLSVVGGLLFFRLICPTIISPQTILPEWEGKISPSSWRTLVLLAKVIQKIATGHIQEMKFLSRFIKKNKPKWSNFFHKLMTGEDRLTGETEVYYEISVEDLVEKSNHDLSGENAKQLEERQMDTIKRLFQLEKNLEGWKQEQAKHGQEIYYKRLANAQLLFKIVAEIPASVEDLFEFMKEMPNNRKIDPTAEDYHVVEKYNDNCLVYYINYKIPLMTDRDFALLQYSEILPEDSFAIITRISVERDDAPPVKGRIRGELFGGYLIRGIPDRATPTCRMTYIYHANGKGASAHIPQAIGKHGATKQATKLFKAINLVFSSQKKPSGEGKTLVHSGSS